MKFNKILVVIIVINLLLNVTGQKLPKNTIGHIENLGGRIELFRIMYDGTGYYFYNEKTVSSIKQLKDSVCGLIKRKNIQDNDLLYSYVSLYLDKYTRISILDSIRNELQGLHFLNVFYKLHGLSNEGYLIRLGLPSDSKIKRLRTLGYYPKITEWDNCNQTDNLEEIYGEEVIIATRQTRSQEIYPRLSNGKLKNVRNHKDLYVFSIINGRFYIDRHRIRTKRVNLEILEILERGNYQFVIDMNNNNNYQDYIKCLEYIISAVKTKREDYFTAHKSKYLARKRYPISMFSYLPSDKRYIKVYENR